MSKTRPEMYTENPLFLDENITISTILGPNAAISETLPTVSAINSIDELDAIRDHLPTDSTKIDSIAVVLSSMFLLGAIAYIVSWEIALVACVGLIAKKAFGGSKEAPARVTSGLLS